MEFSVFLSLFLLLIIIGILKNLNYSEYKIFYYSKLLCQVSLSIIKRNLWNRNNRDVHVDDVNGYKNNVNIDLNTD